MNSRCFVFLAILLAAVLAISSAVEVEQSKDVDKAEEVAEPAYCRYRYCCRRGRYGCQRYCCRGSQAEGDEKDLTVDPEESNDVKPDGKRGGGGYGGGGKGGGWKGGGGRGGGFEETGKTSEADMTAVGVQNRKGGWKGGKGGGKGGKGGGGIGGGGGGVEAETSP